MIRYLALGCGLLAALGAAGRDGVAQLPGRLRPPRPAARVTTAFQLFASSRSELSLDANRVQCNINDQGELCVDPTNSPVYGGGFWPKGTGDQYIYNGGLQIAAIVPDDGSAFAWAGDTVGAYIFDARGDQTAGAPLSGIYDSRDPSDLANWPSAAYVRDTTFFDASLIGQKAASDQDSWVRYWDGNANHPGRTHTMGLLIDQRTLAWNRPEAGRDVLFVLFRIINVTAKDPSRYAGLAEAGYTAEDISAIAKIGADFHARADTAGVHLPDSGFTWTSLYIGYGQDPDVGPYGSNYSTAVLPFAMALAYVGTFSAPTWAYPPDIYAPPFTTAPGLVGTKFLRGPSGPVTGSAPITMFTNSTGGGPFPDRYGVAPLWRMLSHQLLPADGNCNAPIGSPACEVVQVYMDTRWYMGSGPWPTVPPGGSVAFAVAFVFAAPVAAAIQTDGRGHTLGSASFDLKPGVPGTGPRLASGADTVRQIERVAGWTGFGDANGNGDVEQREIQAVPYSLLGKAAVAQALADGKFTLPGPPEAPRFFALPGDGKATVVWEPSATEAVGDLYAPRAANPLSALYDPNFRRFDVEGYRIWRGRTLASMQIVAQFDYAHTTLTDHTGQVFTNVPANCAPELGIVAGCAADFLHGGTAAVPLAGTVVQVPPGGRFLFASGAVGVFRTDTAVTGGGSGAPALVDNGVPFVFVDAGLQNGTTYVYAVTAFDVNSINSGPSSMESALVGRTVTPRGASSNARGAVVAMRMELGDGTPLDTARAFPAIDPNDGTFAGPIPPTNAAAITLPVVVEEMLPAGAFALVLDSIGPGFADGTPGAGPPLAWFSAAGGAAATRGSVPITTSVFGYDPGRPYVYTGPLVPYDSARARAFGVSFGADARMPVSVTGLATGLESSSPGVARAAINLYVTPLSRFLAHSRWFDEGGHEPPNPTMAPFASASHSNGALSNVTAIYSPLPYRLPSGAGAAGGVPRSYRVYLSATLAAWHPGDFVVRWGASGHVTVTDLTHKVPVPWKAGVQPGYGFLNVSALVAAGVTPAQLSDGTAGVTFDPAVASYYSLRTIAPVCTSALAAPCVPLAAAAQLQPVDVNSDGVSDGTGIALVLNGEPFFFLTAALPPEGTAWHLRAVGGGAMSAACSPALPSDGSDPPPGFVPTYCGNYTYTPPVTRPAYVPGLRYTVVVTQQAGADTTAFDLARVHTVPDPLYYTNAGSGGAAPSIRFVNLPERALIRIYTSSGILVAMLSHNDPTAGGEAAWDVTNRGGHPVASGVYFYHVETPDHHVKIGRFTIVQQAWP